MDSSTSNRAPAVITGRKIRFGIVGCGRIAANHFEALKKHGERAELVAACDNDPVAIGEAEKNWKVPVFGSLREMLARTTVDAVSICTPSGLHARQIIEVARAGRHVISEKPMATKYREAIEAVRACDDEGVRLFVVKQNRRNPTLQLLKNAVEQGRFGRIHLVNVNVLWTRPQSYYDQGGWRGKWEMDGGAFMNQASHYVDLLNWIVGPVESVQAYTATRERKIEAEDTGVVALRWRSGALGSMNVTMLTYPKNLEGSITILGEKGTVRIGGVAVNEVQHWEFADSRPEDVTVKDASYQTTSVYGHGHPLYYDNVIATLRGEAKAETDGREGLKSLELLTAIYLSARENKRVSLPLELG